MSDTTTAPATSLPDELRPIEWAPGYFAGSDGHVYSIKLRKAFPRSKRVKYPSVIVFQNGRRLRRFVHQLIAEAFHGPRPDGYQCCHGDGDPSNNRPENLRWGTAADNAADRTRHGRNCAGEGNGVAKLTADEVMEIRAMYAGGAATRTIAEAFQIHQKHAYNVAVGRAWAHLGGAVRRAS